MRAWCISLVLLAGCANMYNIRNTIRTEKLIDAKDWPGARAEIDELLRWPLYPDLRAELYQYRAFVDFQEGRHDEAITDATLCLEIKPFHANAMVLRAAARNQKKEYDEAAKDAARAFDLEPTNHFAYQQHAGAMTGLLRFDEALADCDKAVGIKPDRKDPHMCRGETLVNMGRAGEAIASFQRVLEIEKSADAYNWLAWARFRAGQLDLARLDIELALERAPDLQSALGTRCWIRYARGDREGARADCARSPHPLDQGLLRWIDGDARKALEEWSAAIAQNPVHKSLLTNLMAKAQAARIQN